MFLDVSRPRIFWKDGVSDQDNNYYGARLFSPLKTIDVGRVEIAFNLLILSATVLLSISFSFSFTSSVHLPRINSRVPKIYSLIRYWSNCKAESKRAHARRGPVSSTQPP